MPATNRSKAKRWVFTLNNWTEGEYGALDDLFSPETQRVDYAVIGRETGENNTPHLQGYVIFKDATTFTRVKQLLGDRAHIEVSRGTPKEASDYCKKDGDFKEWGELARAEPKKTDWERLRDWCKEQTEHPTDATLAEHFPSLFGRYEDGVRRFCNLLIRVDSREIGSPRDGWQRQLERIIDQPPDDRRIQFVVDPDGNSGKSWMTEYLADKHPDRAQELNVGKRDDIAHYVDVTKSLFLFDIPRGQLEYLQYPVLEMLKNRRIFSPKYNSRMKKLEHKCHVVVFTNEEPDREALTRDRYDIIRTDGVTHLGRSDRA